MRLLFLFAADAQHSIASPDGAVTRWIRRARQLHGHRRRAQPQSRPRTSAPHPAAPFSECLLEETTRRSSCDHGPARRTLVVSECVSKSYPTFTAWRLKALPYGPMLTSCIKPGLTTSLSRPLRGAGVAARWCHLHQQSDDAPSHAFWPMLLLLLASVAPRGIAFVGRCRIFGGPQPNRTV